MRSNGIKINKYLDRLHHISIEIYQLARYLTLHTKQISSLERVRVSGSELSMGRNLLTGVDPVHSYKSETISLDT